MSDMREFRPATEADFGWMTEQGREIAEFREMIFQRDGRIFDPTIKMVAEAVVADVRHRSLDFSFRCPVCGGPHFGSKGDEYHCHGREVINPTTDNPGWAGCGWSGPAELCFTVPKEVPGEF